MGFLPNTCYLITEWRHYFDLVDGGNLFLRSRYDHVLLVKLCMLSLFYVLYSGFGMLTCVMAIRPIRRAITQLRFDPKLWGISLFPALSLGVYLGLVLRFNSWDLLLNPSKVWFEVTEVGRHPMLMWFIITFGGFLWICYKAVDIWIDGFNLTMSRKSRKL